MQLFVGNLDYDVTERELRDAFAIHVAVKEVTIPRDRDTGKAKGFGFVDLVMESDASDAIEQMNGQELRGRKLTVEVAKPRENRGRGHGAGGRRRW